MSSTSLSIILKAVDEASGPLKRVTDAIRAQGAEAALGGHKTASAWERAYSTIKKVAAGLAAAFTVKKGWDWIKDGAEALDQVGKSARALGLAVEDVSLLRYGAAMAHKDFSEWNDALLTFQKNLSQFQRTGGGRGRDAFQMLGLSRGDLTGANGQLVKFDEVFEKLVERMNSVTDPARRNELGKRLFGEGGASFVRFVAQGTENLRHLREEAGFFHTIFTPGEVEAAEHFRHALARVEQAWLGLKVRLFDAAGPELTRFVNIAAALIARIPDMVRTLMGNVRAAMAGDSSARSIFTSLWVNLRDAAEAGMAVVGDAVGRVWSKYVSVTLSTTTHAIGLWFKELPGRLADWMASAAAGLDAGVLQVIGAINPGLSTAIDRLLEAKQIAGQVLEIGEAGQRQRRVEQSHEYFLQALEEADANVSAFDAAMIANLSKLRESSSALWDGLVKVLGAGEALAMAAKFNAEKAAKPVNEVADALDRLGAFRWSDLRAGIGAGWDELTRKAGEVLEFGKEITTSVTNAVASGLSNAIVDAVAGVKSFKDAIRDLAASTLRMVSQMILQFLVLRAVIAGAAMLGFGPPLAGSSGVPDFGAVGGPYAVTANRGREVPRFAAGGVNTDSVLAMLTPGEHVVRREVAMRNRRELSVLNATGRWPGGGGGSGGGVTINMGGITIAVSGSSTPAQAAKVGQAAARAMIDELQRSPALRGQLKGTLGVRV